MASTFLPTQGIVIDLKKEEMGKHLASGYEVNLFAEKPTLCEVQNYWPIPLVLAAGGA